MIIEIMGIKIEEIKEKILWEDFFSGCEEKTFLQSWNWGEFQKMMGNKIWRLGIYNNGELRGPRAERAGGRGGRIVISVALVIKVRAKRGTFLFVPHGPVIEYKVENMKYEVLKALLEKLKEIAKEEKVGFVRIAPIWEKNEENNKIFKELGFKKAPIHIHPELTWELNIEKKEEELLAEMRKTTRYLIRQGQKNEEITIEQGKKIEDVEKFNELYKTTFDRHHFTPFPFDYLKNEFLTFFPENQISIFLGKYKKEIISSGIFIFWQNIGFYHHGASSLKHPKIPVSYLLLWEAIKEAKIRGCKKFNFWGIASENKKNHPWAGLSLFKMGFGGYKKEYVETQDFPLSSKYWLTWFFEKVRKIKRGL